MTTQFSTCGNYKLENGSLFELSQDGKAWQHCLCTTQNTIKGAIKEYKNNF